jgi:stearoyl-CoA desaturase (Delta-9 desaturase)
MQKKPSSERRYDWASSIPFWGVHVAAVVGVLLLGFSWSGLALALGLYFFRMFGITAGFHRYFSHRSFRTGRVMQFMLALIGGLSVQKGALWWASHHRAHHAYSDTPQDIHSVKQKGFFWAHLGWFLAYDHKETDYKRIPDLAKYPELRWLNDHDTLPAVIFAAMLFFVAGPWALVWGFFVSTTLLWHGTFTINSLAHTLGRRRYETGDESRNSLTLALITMGEGWHNNHHYYQRATSQGFFWWEIDASYYLLRLLQSMHLVSGVTRPPLHVRAATMAAKSAANAAADKLLVPSLVPVAATVPALSPVG